MRKLKREVGWEPLLIPLQLLIEPFSRNTVNFRRCGIQHHALTPHEMNLILQVRKSGRSHDCFGVQEADHWKVDLNSSKAAASSVSSSLSIAFFVTIELRMLSFRIRR